MNKIRYHIILAILSLFTLSGCGNWLDVSPENQVTDEKLFDDYSGFRNALNGIYRELSEQKLYGRELSWGLVSVLAQDYDASRLNKAYPEVATYNYDLADTKNMIDQVWIQMYNAIANCNKLIDEIQKKDGSFFPLGEIEKDLIEGEAHALRAFIHFDLLRLFAPSPKVNADGTYLPYFTSYPSKYEPKQKTSDFLQLVIDDLLKAKNMVAHFDSTYAAENGLYSTTWRYSPQSTKLGRFFNSRGIRLNHMAIHGMLARVYMYAGDETNAEREARFVLEHFVASEGGEDALRFATASELTSGKGLNTKYKSEIMFALYDDNLPDLYEEFKTETNTRFALKAWTDFFTEEGQAERLAEELGWAETGRSFRFLLVQPRHPGKIIGALGFNEIVRGAFQSCFVSYKIDAALWGRGYGSEAIRYGTGWAFRVLGLHRAEANVMPRNAASLRAAEKAGYRPEGLARRYLNINGVWEDHIHMVKLNEEEYHA